MESPLECLLACADAGDRALEHHGGIPGGEVLNVRGVTTDALGSNHSGTGTKTDAELRIGRSAVSGIFSPVALRTRRAPGVPLSRFAATIGRGTGMVELRRARPSADVELMTLRSS